VAELGESLASTTNAALGDDWERTACHTAIARVEKQKKAPGAPGFEARRIELLGRVRGEPALFVEPPAANQLDADLERVRADFATVSLQSRPRALTRRFAGRPTALRTLLLRDGYLYSEDPAEALALVREIELDDLFEEPHIWLLRGEELQKLERHSRRGGFEYRFADGAPAQLLLFDRVAVHPTALHAPVHRDVRDFQRRVGFDRMRVTHLGKSELIAELTFGKRRAPALIRAEGAHLELTCLDVAQDEREAIDRHLADNANRREAIAKLYKATAALVRERLPFDRPREVEDHFSDGHLRPLWEDAYRHGRQAFSHEEKAYLVFDESGRPTPPQTCMAMIVDAYERASGRWYRRRGEPAGRDDGALDFSALGLKNKGGVIGFEEFASELPAFFDAYHFTDAERVPFADRGRFFAAVMAQKGGFLPGDVIAIHGWKPDGYVHQHAILVADVDPLSGFPYLLADQMKLPRFRTFEGIMAEAPRRSLFYRIRPKDELWKRVQPPRDARLAAAR
jgi:hypothetical protein